MNDVLCPLCQSKTHLINDRHPSYQRPGIFSIRACHYCDLQFAWPMRSDSAVYEHIYRQASRLPGYEVYAGLAEGLKWQRAPLDWLAHRGLGYWFIREALQAKLPQTSGSRGPIVEVGSGLGYLTYALNAAGYDVRGLDISATAVEGATARFGDRYFCADIEEYATRQPASVRAAVMTEVIEHVPEPIKMLTALHRLLMPGGFALVTTPNKSVYRAGEYWQTDNPPVHLWWFSETSARRLAQQSGFEIDFWDFSDYNRPGAAQAHRPPSQAPMKPAMLNEDGNIITPPNRSSPIRTLKGLRDRLFPRLKPAKQLRRRQAARQRWADEHGDSMGIVLTKPLA